MSGSSAGGAAGRPRQPLIAVDVVPARFDPVAGLQIGTAIRAAEPAAGQLALPGVLLGDGERLEAAADRALWTKAGIRPIDVRLLVQLQAFDEPGRESREHSVSIAHLAVLGPDRPGRLDWKGADVRGLNLPFDHEAIIDFAREWMAARLWNDHLLTRALTGERFTLAAVSSLEEALIGEPPHTASLRRQLLAPGSGVRQTSDTLPARGTPARVWEWA